MSVPRLYCPLQIARWCGIRWIGCTGLELPVSILQIVILFHADSLDITLIIPASSKKALESAFQSNPYLKSLPTQPKFVAPEDLTHAVGTGDLLRLPEVQSCIKRDFIVLPCDLVSDQDGADIIELWRETQSALGGAADGDGEHGGISSRLGVNGEKCGRRGGMGVWYPLNNDHENPDEDSADFLVAAKPKGDKEELVKYVTTDPASPRDMLCKVVYSAPLDTVKDKMGTNGVLELRQSLLKREGRVKMFTQYRDAHIYIFPYWVKEMAALNDKFESISEDLIGWWAKATWQDGLADKLRMRETAHARAKNTGYESEDGDTIDHLDEHIDLIGMTSTQSKITFKTLPNGGLELPGRQRPLPRADTLPNILEQPVSKRLPVPDFLGYLHQGGKERPMVRRIDSTALLLSMSLRLAKLDATTTPDHPYVHDAKIASPELIAQRTTITKNDTLIGANTTVEPKVLIKESVIGSNCKISSGARLTKCVVMDGVEIGERCTLIGCVVGRNVRVGRESELRECEVQSGHVIAAKTEAKGEKFMIFEGVDEGSEGEDAEDIDVEMGSSEDEEI